MKRLNIEGRGNWEKAVEAQGFIYHSIGGPYWTEDVAYQFSESEIMTIKNATNELHRICMEAVDYVIQKKKMEYFCIPESFRNLVEESWRRQDPYVYGRFDLHFDGSSEPKMFEYNADTPTSLLEASRVQSKWQRTLFPANGQFNSIESNLLMAWSKISKVSNKIHFSSVKGHTEDQGNVEYMRLIANKANIQTKFLFVEDVSWDDEKKCFVDLEDEKIETWFKLYPWEWIFDDVFAKYILEGQIRLIEPAWKILLSSKAILPILWEMFPNHPNLLPSYFSDSKFNGSYVKKPIYGREGSNISIHSEKLTRYVPGPYGKLPSIYQAFCPLPQFSKRYTLVGSWIVNGEAAGIGIRESNTLISENRSRFIPHYVN